ncbi:MAG: hypothetical protein ABIG39_04070 [Candidatus Micrarchaeota archaeon]
MEELELEREEEKKALERSKNEMAIATTGLFFLIFLVPIGFGQFGFPINLYLGVSVAIHEVGHLLFGVLGGGDRIITTAGGTLFEYLNPVVAVVFFARDKRGAALAMIFFACMGSVMPYTASYMENSNAPYGTSYFGGITGNANDMGPTNHDWHIMFSEWGVLERGHEIAAYVRAFGEVFMLIGIVGSVLGFWFMLNYTPAGFSELVVLGSVVSGAYFAWKLSMPQLSLCMAFTILALVWIGVRRWKIKDAYRKGERT